MIAPPEGLLVVVTGENNAVQRRIDRPDVAAYFNAGAVRQARVQDRNVRPQRRDPSGRLLCRTRHPYYQEAFVFQQLLQAPPYQFMVVKDEDPQNSGSVVAARSGRVREHDPPVRRTACAYSLNPCSGFCTYVVHSDSCLPA